MAAKNLKVAGGGVKRSVPVSQLKPNQTSPLNQSAEVPTEADNWTLESLRPRISALAIIVCLVAFLAGVATIAAIKAGPNANAFWIPLIAVLFMLAASAWKDSNSEKSNTIKLNRMTAIAENTKAEICQVLEDNLRPRVITLDDHEKVLAAASGIVGDVLKEAEEDRFLIFIGAASLSTEEDAKGEAGKDDTLTPAADFRNKLMALDVKKIPITRYVSLFSKEDLLQRRHPTRKNYLKWIEKQVGRLQGNPNYVVIDCPRAQPWGGSKSSIITHRAYMDIVGEGDSGLLIKDEEVARTIRERTEKFLEATNKRATYGGGNPEMIKPLELKYAKTGRQR